MYLLDYNIHLDYKSANLDTINAMCSSAITKGIDEIAFVVHMFFDNNQKSKPYDHKQVCDLVESAREHFSGDLFVRLGLEISYQTKYLELIEDFLKENTFDFTIASVHHLNELPLNNQDELFEFFKAHKLPDAYLPYFFEVKRAAECKLFDLIGHFDFIKKSGVEFYGPFDSNMFSNILNGILKTIIINGMGLEINTSGMRQNPREYYPANEILKTYRQLGGEIITVASDAESKDNIGAGIPNALWLAHSTGFEFVTAFENGEPAFIPIEM